MEYTLFYNSCTTKRKFFDIILLSIKKKNKKDERKNENKSFLRQQSFSVCY